MNFQFTIYLEFSIEFNDDSLFLNEATLFVFDGFNEFLIDMGYLCFLELSLFLKYGIVVMVFGLVLLFGGLL